MCIPSNSRPKAVNKRCFQKTKLTVAGCTSFTLAPSTRADKFHKYPSIIEGRRSVLGGRDDLVADGHKFFANHADRVNHQLVGHDVGRLRQAVDDALQELSQHLSRHFREARGRKLQLLVGYSVAQQGGQLLKHTHNIPPSCCVSFVVYLYTIAFRSEYVLYIGLLTSG